MFRRKKNKRPCFKVYSLYQAIDISVWHKLSFRETVANNYSEAAVLTNYEARAIKGPLWRLLPKHEEEAVDKTGLDAKDIELVVFQAGYNRAKVAKELEENDGDLVKSITSLTK